MAADEYILRTDWRLGKVARAVDELRREMVGIDAAAVEAHTNMAKAYQRRLQRNLRDKIANHGRVQRREQRLVRFLGTKRARDADESGWAVGFMERDPLLRLYARNLEAGTRAHEGKRVPGWFLTAGGRRVPPDRYSARKDLFEYTPGYSNGGRAPRMVIERPIVGYRYFEQTSTQWLAAGKVLDAGFYKRAFQKHGLNFSLVWFNNINATASDVEFVTSDDFTD